MPTADDTAIRLGTLMMREENGCWNCYFDLDDKVGVVFLGSIRMTAVRGNAERQQRFVELMRSVLDEIIAEATGHSAIWGEAQRVRPPPSGTA